MTNEDVKNGILKQLDALGLDIPLYDERIKQGFQEPAFFVLLLNSNQTREVDRRYRRKLLFDIHYFPDPISPVKVACNSVAEQLYEFLEYIEWDGNRYRGFDMHHEIVDDVLHFFISFEVFMIKQKPVEVKMQHLKQEERLI
ncbi:hypothetical protein GCM10023310_00890 [Paenibacillus vulneris]|uniref:DUF6838 family protein n=1 Tax=Paenibacillus vulneris TaxID=1133364 RepID=A0ABW3UYI9_9BACL